MRRLYNKARRTETSYQREHGRGKPELLRHQLWLFVRSHRRLRHQHRDTRLGRFLDVRGLLRRQCAPGFASICSAASNPEP
jgi:hypothetical protein